MEIDDETWHIVNNTAKVTGFLGGREKPTPLSDEEADQILNRMAVGKLKPGVVEGIIKGISDACVESNCSLIGGEIAELPGFYKKGEYDLAGFAVGIVERKKIIRGKTVEAGDAVIGLPSTKISWVKVREVYSWWMLLLNK